MDPPLLKTQWVKHLEFSLILIKQVLSSLAKHTRRGAPTRACPERSEGSWAGLVLIKVKELG
jgi:hypothetical protein